MFRVHKMNTFKKKTIITVVIILALAALCFWAFYSGVVIRKYEISSDKIKEENSVRIVVVADLHSHIYGDNQKTLIEKIILQKPDVIALVGDIVDDRQPEIGAQQFLDGIQGIAPIYYVTGNHEYWSGECDRIKQMVAGYGVTVLSNEKAIININDINLCFSGIDDPEILKYTNDSEFADMTNADEILERFSELNASEVNILLAHRPERFVSYQQYDFDIVLSGHAHGGQVRIPLLINGLFAPDQGYFPKYAGGSYKENGQTMIVSRGLGFDERVPRIFNPPEIVVVDIKGE